MENSNKYSYYDWEKTLSYDSEVTMVLTSRGRGKTYGIRLQAIRDAINKDFNFVEICRYKQELSGVMSGYFDKIVSNNEFPEYTFKVENKKAYIAKRPDDQEEKIKKDQWKQIGYFVALSEQQALKKHTFSNVRRIIFDEAVMDKHDKLHHYLYREFDILTNLIDTISRQRPNEKTNCRLYLLGNSVDLLNPYFQRFGISKPPKYGYTWYNNKHFLLHYEEAKDWGKDRIATTMVGHMVSNEEGNRIMDNTFNINNDFIEIKPKNATFRFGIVYENIKYGVWFDWNNGLVYINSKIPSNTSCPIFALTLSDNKINYLMAKKSENSLKAISDLVCQGLVRYSNAGIKESFSRVLSLFGLK